MLETFYHITEKDLGSTCVLEPRDPGEVFHGVKRVCVSPTPRQCLQAIGGMRNNHEEVFFHVYQIDLDLNDSDLDLDRPKKIGDWHITNEAWILKPRLFRKLGVLERFRWGTICCGVGGRTEALTEPEFRIHYEYEGGDIQ